MKESVWQTTVQTGLSVPTVLELYRKGWVYIRELNKPD